jgi:protoheme IX farnesyltransferase
MARAIARPRVRVPSLRDVVELTKPRITMMSVLVAAGSMALAPQSLGWTNALLSLLAVGLSVAGAGALNMYLERDVDGLMTRTRTRPLPEGRMDPFWALLVGGTLAFASLPLMAIASNGPIATALTGFALFLYVLVYTPMKQRSPWSLVVGAVPGAMPALMGYAAASGALDMAGLCLFGIVFFWQLPHFLAIGMYREQEYVAAGHKLFNTGRTVDFTKTMIIATTAPLIACSVMLWPLGVGSWVYGAVASLLGVWFTVLCVSGFTASNANRWARRVFFGTLAYQTILFAVLGLDVGLRALFF